MITFSLKIYSCLRLSLVSLVNKPWVSWSNEKRWSLDPEPMLPGDPNEKKGSKNVKQTVDHESHSGMFEGEGMLMTVF